MIMREICAEIEKQSAPIVFCVRQLSLKTQLSIVNAILGGTKATAVPQMEFTFGLI